MILKNEMNQTLQYLAKRGNIVRLFGKPELEEKDNAPPSAFSQPFTRARAKEI